MARPPRVLTRRTSSNGPRTNSKLSGSPTSQRLPASPKWRCQSQRSLALIIMAVLLVVALTPLFMGTSSHLQQPGSLRSPFLPHSRNPMHLSGTGAYPDAIVLLAVKQAGRGKVCIPHTLAGSAPEGLKGRNSL